MAVTGATGFVGGGLLPKLVDHGHAVTALIRRETPPVRRFSNRIVRWAELSDQALIDNLQNVDVVVHMAARVHQMHEQDEDVAASYWAVNVEQTVRLAKAAAKAGVKRLVFVSTAKVYGETTENGEQWTEESHPNPVGSYAETKLEAEKQLLELATQGVIEVVIIRPPLVYGKEAKGNLASLGKLIDLQLPLPFGCVTNRRSLVSLDNLVSLISICVSHPKAAGEVLNASDAEVVSLKEILRGIGRQRQRKVRLMPLPVCLLRMALCCIGKRSMGEKLLSNLEVSSQKASRLLNWEPVPGLFSDMSLREVKVNDD